MKTEVLMPFSALARSVKVGSVYQHYKKISYKVLAIARHSETLEEMVVYQALYGENDVWIRPVTMFLEENIFEGKMQPRFSLCLD
jgi:hypothetical protein